VYWTPLADLYVCAWIQEQWSHWQTNDKYRPILSHDSCWPTMSSDFHDTECWSQSRRCWFINVLFF